MTHIKRIRNSLEELKKLLYEIKSDDEFVKFRHSVYSVDEEIDYIHDVVACDLRSEVKEVLDVMYETFPEYSV